MIARGAPQKKISVADVAGAATYNYGELISGSSTALKPFADVDDSTGQVEIEPHSAISLRGLRRRGGGRRRDRRGRRREARAGLRRRPRDQPDARRGADRGRRDHGPRARAAGEQLSVLPVGRAPRRAVRRVPRAGAARPAELDNVIIENPSADGPFGAKAIGEMANNAQPPAIANAIFDAVGVWLTEMPATPDRVLQALADEARADARRQARRLRRAPLGEDGVVERRRGVLRCPGLTSARSAAVPHLERPRLVGVRRRRAAARDRRRAGAPLPRRVRARQAGAVAQARRHGAGDVHPRRRGRDDDRGRHDDAARRRRRRRQPRPPPQALLGERRHVHRRRSRRCRSTTSRTATSTSCSAPTAARSTWRGRRSCRSSASSCSSAG